VTVRTIVFGDDDSPSADLAWLWINCHTWPGWRLEVLRATDPVAVKVAAHRPEPRSWIPANPRRPFQEAQLEDLDFLIVDEDPRLALLRDADLTVIGPRGRGFLKAIHVGSTAEFLMTRPVHPLLIVRHGRPTQSVVVCHDGSANARVATAALCRLPWAPGLKVTIVVVRDGCADVEYAIEAATTPLIEVGAEVSTRVLRGEPTDELLRFVDDDQPDLVVLGASALGGPQQLVVDSPANIVAHRTQVSVLLGRDSDS
jgi:nucleotide-binding universal stress UspA family protein